MWLPLCDIPAEGREFSFSDAALWSEVWHEFGLDYRMKRPLRARLRLFPQLGDEGEGVHVHGELEGSVLVPCGRCMEEAEAVVDVTFDDFEALDEDAPPPAEPAPSHGARKSGRRDPGGKAGAGEAHVAAPASADLTPSLVRRGAQGLEFDVQGYLWQQFVLALPVKPLCAPGCLGLCPQCGADRNLAPCQCREEEGDPRLAILRTLKRS